MHPQCELLILSYQQSGLVELFLGVLRQHRLHICRSLHLGDLMHFLLVNLIDVQLSQR